VRWLNKNYEEALKLLAQHGQDVFDLPSFRWKANDYRVRCLVKLKRNAEALREAESIAKREHGNQLLVVLAHAVAGNVKQTLAVMEKNPLPYLLETYYQDPDLGPILRSEPFRPFREKFPEPKNLPLTSSEN
jgi:hypothetical protein